MRRLQITPLFESPSHPIRKAAAFVSILVVLTFVSRPGLAGQNRRHHSSVQTPPPVQTIHAIPSPMTFPWPSCWLYTSLGLGVWVFGLRRKAILLRHEYEANREELNRKMNARNHEVLLLKSEAFSHQEKLIPLQKSLEAKTMELASTERKLAETNARLSRILELYPDAEEKAAEVTRKKAEQKAAIAEAKRIQALRQKKVLAVLNEMKGGG